MTDTGFMMKSYGLDVLAKTDGTRRTKKATFCYFEGAETWKVKELADGEMEIEFTYEKESGDIVGGTIPFKRGKDDKT